MNGGAAAGQGSSSQQGRLADRCIGMFLAEDGEDRTKFVRSFHGGSSDPRRGCDPRHSALVSFHLRPIKFGPSILRNMAIFCRMAIIGLRGAVGKQRAVLCGLLLFVEGAVAG